MNGKKAKRLRREARKNFPMALGANNVVYSGLKTLQNVTTSMEGTVKGEIVGGNRHLGKDNIKKINRVTKKLRGHKSAKQRA